MKQNILLITALLISVSVFSQFNAELLNVVSGRERLYKVYSNLQQYRYEFNEDGLRGIVIVFPEKNETYILMPDKKFVQKTTCDGLMSRSNDPVQSYIWFKKKAVEKNAGIETINGINCHKNELFMNDQKIFISWHSDKYNFPIRIVNNMADNTYMELRNIEKWKVDPALFTIPDDYTEVDQRMRPVIPEPPPPDNWTTINENIPYEGEVNRGTKVKITIGQTKNHKVFLVNAGEGPAKVIHHLIREGSELPDNMQGPLEYRTKRLFKGENKTNTYSWKSGDEIIFEVYEGTMKIKVLPE